MSKTFATLKSIRMAAQQLNTELAQAQQNAEQLANQQGLTGVDRDNFVAQESLKPFLTLEFKDILEKLPLSCKELIDELTSIQNLAFNLAKGTFNVPVGTSYEVNDGTKSSLVVSSVDITTEDNINLDVAIDLCEKHFNVEIKDASDIFGALDENLKGVCRSTTIRSKRNLLKLYKEGKMEQGQSYYWLMPCVTPAKKLGSQLQFEFIDADESNVGLLSLNVVKKRTKSSCDFEVSSSEDILNKFAEVANNLSNATSEEILAAVGLVNSIGALLLSENGFTEEVINNALNDLKNRYPGGLTINTGIGVQSLKITKPSKTIDGNNLTNKELVEKYPDFVKDKVIGVTTQYRFSTDAAYSSSKALADAVAAGDVIIQDVDGSVSTSFKANKTNKEEK